jgi:hypothetical protein
MEIEQIDTIPLSIELLTYFHSFKDFPYHNIHSIVESIKTVYKVVTFEAISQILYLHKVKLNFT